MNPERWRRIENIYNSVLEHRPEEREAVLRQACEGDESIRKEVESLLACDRRAEHFIEQRAIEVAAQQVAGDSLQSYMSRTLLHYSVDEEIGRGGMGVVYRARDTNLNRVVAVKVLPQAFSEDRERLARFKREARLLASLSHPNIATIHGFEESDGEPFLVFELVEGKTLAERLRSGPVPVSEAVEIGRQLAEGLEAAHAKGVIHRDLKPANIKITPEGKVKILDFGLAKALADEIPPSDLMQSPTITQAMSRPGVLLGTAAYMSPEQATGKPVDQRTDNWAFGCILFECVTGRRAFPGETASETLASVLKEDPDWSALPKEAPESLRAVLRACLQKDPAHRLRSVADAWIGIEPSAAQSAKPIPAASSRWVIAIVVCSLAAVALVVAVWFGSRSKGSAGTSDPVPLTNYAGIECQPAFSPDGNYVAFAWRSADPDSNFQIYTKHIGSSGDPLPLTNSPDYHVSPAWSPDGNHIAYGVGISGKSFRICVKPPLGGAEQVIGEIGAWGQSVVRFAGSKIAWTPDSKWLVVPDSRERGLFLLSLETGEKRRLTETSTSELDPAISPDGRTLAFVRRAYTSLGSADVFLLELGEKYEPRGESRRLTFEGRDVHSPVWTPNGEEILFSSGAWMSERRLLRVPATIPGDRSEYRPVRMTFGENASTLSLSGANRRLVYTREFWNSSLYIAEVSGNGGRAPKQLVRSSGANYTPDFSPDGRRIAFTSTRSGSEEIWVCDADGRNTRQLTSMKGPLTARPCWSPDGKRILFHSDGAGSRDLYVVGADEGRPRRITDHPAGEKEARWSRDGKWIYFESNRTGSNEIYRMPATGGEPVRLTTGGGVMPFESSDGRWVFFQRPGVIPATGPDLWKVPWDSGAEILVRKNVGWYAAVEGGVYHLGARKQLGARNQSRAIDLRFFDLLNLKDAVLLETDRPRNPPPMGLTVSPDRQWVVFPLWDRFDSDLMLVENFQGQTD